MYRLLFAASTESEIQDFIDSSCRQISAQQYCHNKFNDIIVLITGIGMVRMTLQLSRFLTANNVIQSINVGFCGSFEQKIPLGSLVHVRKDVFAETGVSDNENYIIPFDQLIRDEKLLKHLYYFVEPQQGIQNMTDYPDSVNGITVNTCTGDLGRAEFMINQFDAQTESMEGAAFFMTCNSYNIPCAQIRAVSNLIPGRSPERWNIGKAQTTLSDFLDRLVFQINQK